MANASKPDSVLKLSGFPPGVKNVPAVWPSTPSPNKISLLFKYNSHNIYHDAPTPWTDGNNPFGIIPNKQPFVYRYPDEAQNSFFAKLPRAAKTLANDIANINQSSIDDIYRVSKFLLTSNGILFLTKQTALQAYTAFPETSVYNPLETLIATVQPVSLGLLDKPRRYLDADDPLAAIGFSNQTIIGRIAQPINSGISGLLGSLGVGSKPKPQQLPSGHTNEKSGILRIPTGNRAKAILDSKWQAGSLADTLGGFLKSAVDPLIPSFIPRKAPNMEYRQDEMTYGGMIQDKMGNLKYYDRYGAKNNAPEEMVWRGALPKSVYQSRVSYIPAGVNTNKSTGRFFRIDRSFKRGKKINGNSTGYFIDSGQSINDILGFDPSSGVDGLVGSVVKNVAGGFIPDALSGPLGLSNDNSQQPSVKYGEYVGISPNNPDSFKNSDMLVNYAEFLADDGTHFLSRLNNESAPYGYQVQYINDNMKQAIDKIGKKTGAYTTNVPPGINKLISSGDADATSDGYSRIDKLTDKNIRYKRGDKSTYGVGVNYHRNVGVGGKNTGTRVALPLDSVFKTKNLRFSTTFTSDGINMLPVLKGDKKFNPTPALSAMYPDWTEWSPENDDLVAFYFYDVVNNKYIPFRATVKGISEGNNAYWDELRFIGRADQLYSYNGYNRTLSFTFNVVINSIHEMLPTFKKINYLAGVVKPSNYTKSGKVGNQYSEFIVPPMFMITIGDLYKYQPIVITSLNINIPDDAQWETLNENNASRGWSYLNGIIKSPMVRGGYAQLPKEFEIAVTCNLLEKEKAIVGAAHFGHAPHTDNYEDGIYNVDSSTQENRPFLPQPTNFSENMVEYTEIGKYTPTTTNPSTLEDRQYTNLDGYDQSGIGLVSTPDISSVNIAIPSVSTPTGTAAQSLQKPTSFDPSVIS